MDLKWEEPTATERQPGQPVKHLDVAEKLRANPGRWGRVNTKSSEGAAVAEVGAIRSGHLKAFSPKGSFVAMKERHFDDETGAVEWKVFAKFVGQVNHPQD